jgi:hypothetical protein
VVHRCFQRERERERRKMTTLESAEAHTHSRTHARACALPPATSHSVLDVATKNKSLVAEDALQRRGRSGSRPPDGAA